MGDLSRWAFDPLHDYSDLLYQQGRVDTDADRNEAASIVARRVQAGTLDTIGRAAVPRETPDGFRIDAVAGKLTIGYGRMYVDGLLAENHETGSGRFDPHLAEISGAQHAGENAAPPGLDFASQPYAPLAGPGAPPPFLTVPGAGTRALAYLKVWKREITSVQAPQLLEKALGIDTTTRLQTVWQVRLLATLDPAVTCDTALADVPGFLAAEPPAGGRLTSKLIQGTGAGTPCEMPVADGYRGLENQLYRIEVHTGGGAGATFKWSRDNATLASAVTSILSPTRIVLDALGHDEVLTFGSGDWVEVTDDARELLGRPGDLRRIAANGVERATRTLTLEQALSAGDFVTGQRGLRVRRWDQRGKVMREPAPGSPLVEHVDLDAAGANGEIPIPTDGSYVVLENNIAVSFALTGAGGQYRPGDFWLDAARTADASIELLDAAPPLGIHAHYAKLGILTLPDTETDCRTLWPPATGEDCCDCTVCVSEAQQRSDGRAIQNALESLRKSGGTLCLGPGDFLVPETLRLRDLQNVRVRGQGLATRLAPVNGGALIEITGSTSITLEDFTARSAVADVAMVGITDTVDVTLERLALSCGPADGPGQGNAIALGGDVMDARVRGCDVRAGRGLTTAATRSGPCSATRLQIADNRFECSIAGVDLGSSAVLLGTTRITANYVHGGELAGISIVAVTRSGVVHVEGNELEAQGIGVAIGANEFLVAGNDISGGGMSGSDGVAIMRSAGLPVIASARIMGNTVNGMRGHGVAIRGPVASCMIKSNVFEDLLGGGVVMDGAGSCGRLVVENNQLTSVGLAANAAGSACGLSFAGVAELDVRTNALAGVGRGERLEQGCAGILAVACDRVRISANQLAGVGPLVDLQPECTGVRVVGPFLEVAVESNSIRRRLALDEQLSDSRWTGIEIGLLRRRGAPPSANAPSFATVGAYALWNLAAKAKRPAAGRSLLFTAGRLLAKPAPAFSAVLVHANLVEVESSGSGPLLLTGASSCRVTSNRFRVDLVPEPPLPKSYIGGVTAVVSSNDFLSSTATIQVPTVASNGSPAATVVGNVSTLPISLNSDLVLKAPWDALNLTVAI